MVLIYHQNHIVEEVSKLGDGELNLGSELGVTSRRLDLVVLVSNGSEWLEVRVSEDDMGLLDISKGGARGLSLANLGETAVQKSRSHKHAVLSTVIRNELKNTSGGHFFVITV